MNARQRWRKSGSHVSKSTKSQSKAPNNFDSKDEILLEILAVVDRDSNVSQRTISREVGVALGLANAYLKRCVRKGWIKVQQIPPHRYSYYLTSKGFSEKARLTGEYLSSSFTFFRRARTQMSELMADCAKRNRRRIALAGISELAEVGILSAADHSVTLVGIIDAHASVDNFRGLPVVRKAAQLADVDVVIVTDVSQPHLTFAAVQSHFGEERILAPRLLQLSQNRQSNP
jgi:DNA-binding MarR family transcriptional regulator